MNSRFMLMFSAISGFVFVALGAFGAHVLSKFHTLAILALSVLMRQRRNLWFYWSSIALALGTVLFSGSLYCLALSHLRFWAFVTPVGGLFFLTGWVLMLIGVLRQTRKAKSNE
ncbi:MULTISPECIES: DUF423 domain-containing protein [Symbiopectobacterium]|uniref:DUF423 domain-containing protein n=1 Tax=Symbiopectobacterium TaxID=801 RepID=UPI001A30DFC6|nr:MULTISPECIES: DUF423 domain-containing protein [Symbiopectobacterium]MBG6247166.1 DUF423 domain-containing protein [Candidatus Symbiopectobacterium sp. PLON1]MBT9428230.1 DUF423 domain-containing protein [Candidatus Symbiopectobacterium endolongispinus]